MALTITKQSGIYEIDGVLNSQNISAIKNYFELIIEKSAYIKMSLNKIIDLDFIGVQFIASLYIKAVEKNKVFFIVGVNNKEIVQLFKKEEITTY